METNALPGFDPLADYRAEIDRKGAQLAAARRRVELTTDSLRGTVRAAVEHGMSELEASKLAGVTRATVRTWLGK